jgi:hypothetical protein
MRENARSTRRAIAGAKETAAAIAAANLSAEAANRHASSAEKSAMIQLRSYLVADRIEVHGTPNQNSVYVTVVIKNAGATPARITKCQATTWITQDLSVDPINGGPAPKDYFHLRDWFPQGSEGKILVGSDDSDLISKMNITDKADFYIYGRIEYIDVFGIDRWMTFAYRPNAWGVKVGNGFTPCIHGNDGD